MGSRLKSLVSNSKVFHVCSNTTPFYFINYLKQNGGLISRGLDPCQSLKACKNITEISGTRNAHLRDGVAVTKFICWLSKSGVTAEETEISAGVYLEKERKKQARKPRVVSQEPPDRCCVPVEEAAPRAPYEKRALPAQNRAQDMLTCNSRT